MIRILTWNVWHALSPYGWGWLGPVVLPRLETRREASLRQARQVKALCGLRKSDFDIFCLQEINPVMRRAGELADELEMRSAALRCNAGVKLGEFGLPLHLSEGLVTLTGQGIRKRKTVRVGLSGKAFQCETFLGFPVFAQLRERRCALLVESKVRGKKVMVANLHLHNGSETDKAVVFRRKKELTRLSKVLKRRASEADLLVVCGDFNAGADAKELEPLLELGLVDAAVLAQSRQKPTWDPRRNRLTRVSTEVASERINEWPGWESQAHVFDRIYLRAKTPLGRVRLKRVCDAPMLSDHYGVLAEISF